MFHFPGYRSLNLSIQNKVTGHYSSWVAPFGNLRVKACSAALRSLSQLYHVLHRLPTPRHPPRALSSLTLHDILLSSNHPARCHQDAVASLTTSFTPKDAQSQNSPLELDAGIGVPAVSDEPELVLFLFLSLWKTNHKRNAGFGKLTEIYSVLVSLNKNNGKTKIISSRL